MGRPLAPVRKKLYVCYFPHWFKPSVSVSCNVCVCVCAQSIDRMAKFMLYSRAQNNKFYKSDWHLHGFVYVKGHKLAEILRANQLEKYLSNDFSCLLFAVHFYLFYSSWHFIRCVPALLVDVNPSSKIFHIEHTMIIHIQNIICVINSEILFGHAMLKQ